MTATIKRKPALVPDWEKKVREVLTEAGVIAPGFSGKLSLAFNNGSIAGAELVDRLK